MSQPPNWQPGANGQPQYPAPGPQHGHGGAYGPGQGHHGQPPYYGHPQGHWPQPPAQQPQSDSNSGGGVWVGLVAGIGIAVIVGYAFLPRSRGSSDSLESLPNLPSISLRSPRIVTDEDLVVDAGGAQMRGFSLPTSGPVKVVIEGKQDTAKGFNVFVMEPSDWSTFKARKRFEYVSALSSMKTRSYSKTANLPVGAWCVVVQNSNALFEKSVNP